MPLYSPQSAAGVFDHLEGVVFSYESKISTQDLQPEVLKALSLIMLAQAQESFLKKARQGWYGKAELGGVHHCVVILTLKGLLMKGQWLGLVIC